MSRRHCHCESRKHFCGCESRRHFFGCENNVGFLGGFGEKGDCCCSFPTLVILILIILQFSRNKGFGGSGRSSSTGGSRRSGFGLENNGILFIIALFFLACCNPCKRIGY